MHASTHHHNSVPAGLLADLDRLVEYKSKVEVDKTGIVAVVVANHRMVGMGFATVVARIGVLAE